MQHGAGVKVKLLGNACLGVSLPGVSIACHTTVTCSSFPLTTTRPPVPSLQTHHQGCPCYTHTTKSVQKASMHHVTEGEKFHKASLNLGKEELWVGWECHKRKSKSVNVAVCLGSKSILPPLLSWGRCGGGEGSSPCVAMETENNHLLGEWGKAQLSLPQRLPLHLKLQRQTPLPLPEGQYWKKKVFPLAPSRTR